MITDFTAARQNMLDSQVRTNDVPDMAIQDAMATAPRERFCKIGREHLAYAEVEIEYAPSWFLLKPRDIAKLLHALSPRGGEAALCIAGPYAAMVLTAMGLEVTLRLPAGDAQDIAMAALNGSGVRIESSELGAPISGAYDLIVVEGAVPSVPASWLEPLARPGHPGRRLGVVERDGPVGKAKVYRGASDGIIGARESFDATPPLLKGFEPATTFSF